jgi:hypothetical protein
MELILLVIGFVIVSEYRSKAQAKKAYWQAELKRLQNN